MESFGLFHLLNSLLAATPKNDPQSESPTPPSPPELDPPTQPSTPPNACVEFFMRHEERARKRSSPL